MDATAECRGGAAPPCAAGGAALGAAAGGGGLGAGTAAAGGLGLVKGGLAGPPFDASAAEAGDVPLRAAGVPGGAPASPGFNPAAGGIQGVKALGAADPGLGVMGVTAGVLPAGVLPVGGLLEGLLSAWEGEGAEGGCSPGCDVGAGASGEGCCWSGVPMVGVGEGRVVVHDSGGESRRHHGCCCC